MRAFSRDAMMTDTTPPAALMLDLEGPALLPDEKALLQDPQIGGVILFARNCLDRSQVESLTRDIRQCNPQLLIAVDQEGGRVQRLREGFTRLPPLRRLGQLLEKEPETAVQLAHACGWLMAAEVLACGIDFSFAPVLDLDTGISEVIGDRAFASEVGDIVKLATAYLAGMHEAGMATTGKHFPGHGSIAADSHTAIPRDDRALAEIRERDMQVFAHCLPSLDAIMPAHVIYPALDAGQPAGFSRRWLQDTLRAELGFEGVIFSDDLCMAGAAIAGDMVARVDAAVEAGCDMLLVCNDRQQALAALERLHMLDLAPVQRLATMRRRTEPDAMTAKLAARRDTIQRQLETLQ